MNKKLAKKLLKHQIISMAHVSETLEVGIFDEYFIDGFRGICGIDTIVLDHIPIPKHNTEGDEDYDTKKPLCNRDWYYEQLSCISQEVKFGSHQHSIVNDKEIDSYLDDFLEVVYENQIQ